MHTVATHFERPTGQDDTYPIVRFKFGSYQHLTVRHMVGLMRKHGDLIKFSLWVIEAANKHWKRLLSEHSSRGGGRNGRKCHIAFQVLKWYLRMVNPEMVLLSMRNKRIRGVQTCSSCGEERNLGHSMICRGQVDFVLVP